MGAMSIVEQHPDEGFSPESSDRTWVEVVKAACSVEGRDIVSLDSPHYPAVVEQSWIHAINDAKDHSKTSAETFVDCVLRRVENGFEEDKEAYRIQCEEERELVRFLREKMYNRELTETSFLGVLHPYLVLLKYKAGVCDTRIAADEPNARAVSSCSDKRSTLVALERVACNLGPIIVSVVLDCCIMLRLWPLVDVLLKKRVLDTRECSKVVESAIESQRPRTLCLCITHAIDLAPQDVHSILEFLVNSIENTPKSFLVVQGEWRRLALQKIKALKSQSVASSEVEQRPSYETVLALAKAIDAFSPPELCLHHLVASHQDESVLSSVVTRLEVPQLLRLLQYLCKWVDIYSSKLGRYPNPKILRVPSMNQVLVWISVILEVNYIRFVLSSDFHPVVKALKKVVQPLVEMCIHLTPLIGIVDHHIRGKHPIHTKTRVQADGAATDYVIELLDLG